VHADQLLAAASFNYQTKNSYSIQVRSTDPNLAYFEKTFTINILDITAPTVVGIQVNDGSAQRSMVKSLTVTFSEPVELGAAFVLEMADGSAVADTALVVSGSGNVYTIRFKGTAVLGSSLADGAYRLRVIPSGVHDPSGNALPSEFAFTFKRLFGDYDGNGSVNAADYYYFKAAFGKSKGDSGYVDCMDFDGNGVVNAADYYYFKRNFGKSI
jgi:methionine-rich copper-binding protein CopC